MWQIIKELYVCLYWMNTVAKFWTVKGEIQNI